MAGYPHDRWRSSGWPRRNPLFVVLIALICLTGFYAVGGRHFQRVERAPAAPRALGVIARPYIGVGNVSGRR